VCDLHVTFIVTLCNLYVCDLHVTAAMSLTQPTTNAAQPIVAKPCMPGSKSQMVVWTVAPGSTPHGESDQTLDKSDHQCDQQSMSDLISVCDQVHVQVRLCCIQ
jgi:hypothetical protein